ncbi:MAG: hypothetical protein JWO95_1040 [Verrucomicrobiales bacterium]|nr:hypothetical protein [Verrucomicrobiales bacterium]
MESNASNQSTPIRKSFVRRIFTARVLLFGLAALVTFIALYHAEENWRGARAWKKFKREREAAGEVMSANSLVPPPVPDDQNFAMTPFFAPFYDFIPGTQKQRDTNAVERAQNFAKNIPDAPTVSTNDSETDLVGFANAILHPKDKPNDGQPMVTDRVAAARVVLQTLNQLSPIFDELRAASQRPYVRFNIAYDWPDKIAIVLPHLMVLKPLSRNLSIRATAELALNQTDAAMADTKLGLYIAETASHEGIVISELVRAAALHVALQSLVIGLRDHQWTDAQLEQLEVALQKIDLIDGMATALNGESKVLVNSAFERLRTEHNRLKLLESWSELTESRPAGAAGNPIAQFLFWVAVPRGWVDFEQLNYERLFYADIMSAIDTQNHSVDPVKAARGDEEIQNVKGLGLVHNVLHHEVIALIALPALTRIAFKTTMAQADINMATVACALERYRLAHGQFPADLNGLVPQFLSALPNDAVKGGALNYRRDGGTYVLYSIGWNATDDGGKVVVGKNSKADAKQGDWVWGVPGRN